MTGIFAPPTTSVSTKSSEYRHSLEDTNFIGITIFLTLKFDLDIEKEFTPKELVKTPLPSTIWQSSRSITPFKE